VAIRRWQVHPDETGIVSREALISAFIDAAALLDIAGGALTVVTGRAPTGLPGEMVTTGVMLEWRDRTDAKPQPEAPSTVTTTPKATGEMVGAGEVEGLIEAQDAYNAETEAGFKYQPEAAAPAAEPDGFDYSKLEDEDVEEAAEVTR
jgi:hypothetical protein